MPPVGHPLRPAAINLYKRLHRIGRDYPNPNYHFLEKLRGMSAQHAQATEEEEVRMWLRLGEHIYKGEKELRDCGSELRRRHARGTTAIGQPHLTACLAVEHLRWHREVPSKKPNADHYPLSHCPAS